MRPCFDLCIIAGPCTMCRKTLFDVSAFVLHRGILSLKVTDFRNFCLKQLHHCMFTSVSLTFFVNFSHLFLQSMIQKVFFIVLHDKSYCYTKETQGKKGVPSPLKYTLS